MQLNQDLLTTVNGYREGGQDAADEVSVETATRYKRDVCKNYISLNPEQLDTRLPGTSFFATRKYDGELAVMYFDGQQVFTINTGGRVRIDLPCHIEAAAALQAAGIGQAVIPAELYAVTAGRERVFAIRQTLAEGRLGDLALAPFDILSIDGEPFPAADYSQIHAELARIFGATQLCRPVIGEPADSKKAVRDLYHAWVEGQGAEGLVVRSELPVICKLKPQYTIDAAVVGFSEGLADAKGQVRSLLVALLPEDGVFQVIGRVGGGLSTGQRQELFVQLSGMEVPSSFIETDANHVAFHMVRPELVVEVTVNDVLYESTAGPIVTPLLDYSDTGWRRTGSAPGASIVFPVFSRMRDDKAPNSVDARYSQIEEIAWQPVMADDEVTSVAPPASQILRRQVYTKTLGGNPMVMKFMAWETGKQQFGYPAYVVTYVNFSAGRRDPLAVETRISDSREQILEMFDGLVDENVKKGWVPA